MKSISQKLNESQIVPEEFAYYAVKWDGSSYARVVKYENNNNIKLRRATLSQDKKIKVMPGVQNESVVNIAQFREMVINKIL